MAYTNFDLIINQALSSLLKTEFTVTGHVIPPIVYFDVFRKSDLTKGEYIRYYSNGNVNISQLTKANTRQYNYQLSYYFQYSGDQKKTKFEGRISDRVNHLYDFLLQNISYSPSSSYKWHHLEFESISAVLWGVEDIENTEDIAHVDMDLGIFRTNEET